MKHKSILLLVFLVIFLSAAGPETSGLPGSAANSFIGAAAPVDPLNANQLTADHWLLSKAPSQGRGSRAVLLDPQNSAWKKHAPESFRAKFETSKGTFIVEAHRNWAPIGVDRFYNLVRSGFFSGSRFFRIRAGFIAQFGIAGDPEIAGKWRDQAIPDDPVRQSNRRGFISYAMTGPNARTTQIFINLADNSRLDSEGFAPIGQVVAGMDVVDSLYAGYGETSGGGMRGGKQAKLFEEGNPYLDREFPRLDRLLQCTIERKGN